MSTSAVPSLFVSNRPPRSMKTRMGPAVRISFAPAASLLRTRWSAAPRRGSRRQDAARREQPRNKGVAGRASSREFAGSTRAIAFLSTFGYPGSTVGPDDHARDPRLAPVRSSASGNSVGKGRVRPFSVTQPSSWERVFMPQSGPLPAVARTPCRYRRPHSAIEWERFSLLPLVGPSYCPTRRPLSPYGRRRGSAQCS